MKKILILLLFPLAVLGQGNVLQTTTGGIRTADGSITQAQVQNLVTDLSGKQATLISGTNIKTVNGSSLLGSGDIAISGTAAWGNVTGTLSNQSDLQTVLNTLLPKTVTAGVANCPTASGTQTITHNLGRTPTTIHIYGKGRFTSNAAATPTPSSDGVWCSSGNFCLYQTTAGTTTSDPLSSNVFAVFIATSSGNTISGVIQNVTATDFQIQWTETGTAVALPILWKAQ